MCRAVGAPEAVVDINSTDLISLGSFSDKVGLFGRRKEAAVSRIMPGRDSRSVRFVVPDRRIVDRGYHDVTVVDMEEEWEPMVVLSDMTRLRELWPVEVFDHTVQITFIFIGQTHLVFGKRVCTCVTKHSNAFRTFLNWLKNSKRVWHQPKLHILRLPIFANFDL